MRKELTIGFGLVVVVLAIVGPPLAVLSLRPYEPPLQIGMTETDVESVLGEPVPITFEWVMEYMEHVHSRAEDWTDWVNSCQPIGSCRLYEIETNWLGSKTNVWVGYGPAERVETWEVYRMPRSRPAWLDTARKWIGW